MMTRLSSCLAALAGCAVLGTGCIDPLDEGDPAEAAEAAEAAAAEASTEAVAEQAATVRTVVIRAASVPGQVVDVLFPASGAFVRMSPANITSQQRWRIDGHLIRHNNQPNLCLQPESAAVGARLILRPCETPTFESLQRWIGLNEPNGKVSIMNEPAELWIDASAGAFGILRLAPQSSGPQQDFVLATN